MKYWHKRISLHKFITITDSKVISRRENNDGLFRKRLHGKLYTMSVKPFVKANYTRKKNPLESENMLFVFISYSFVYLQTVRLF